MSVFREDVVALVPHLRAFARSLTGGDVHFADDIVQDTIVNALQAQRQFTPGTNLKAWLFTILRNRFRSLIARKHVTAEVADDDLERHYWVGAEQESRIEVAAFKRAFRLLSAAHREVLVLVAIHGLPYEQIAEICGCEVGTVKSRVNRARGILRRMLMDDGAPVDAGRPRGMERASQVPEADDLAQDLVMAAGNPRVPAARPRPPVH
jgi:RNA polymerase sigma-70 factor (ECF subfamily)